MPFSQVKMGLAVMLLLAAFVDRAACSFTMTKVIPVKPGVMNQTFVVNVPPTVERTEHRGNDTSAQLVLPPQPQAVGGGDCLLSDCDENDVGCDVLPPCGPYCPQEACPRVNCSQCWQGGFSGPCCWSCCSQYMPYANSQLPPTAPQQRQQPAFFPYPQPEAIPLPQAQPIPIPQQRPIPIPQSQAIPIQPLGPFPIAQSRPIPIPQPQPIPIARSQPIPIPQPQPIQIAQPQPFTFAQSQPMLIPQPRPIPIPVSVPQPYTISQPISYAQFQPRVQYQPQALTYSPECRPTSSWPFMQCLPPSGCPYQTGCVPQPSYSNWCYTIGLC